MIKAKDIKLVLSQIPVGTEMSVGDIQALVKKSCPLNNEDWAIHTKTRPTNYRKWLHRIQGVLAEYKRNGIVTHDPVTHIYMF